MINFQWLLAVITVKYYLGEEKAFVPAQGKSVLHE